MYVCAPGIGIPLDWGLTDTFIIIVDNKLGARQSLIVGCHVLLCHLD